MLGLALLAGCAAKKTSAQTSGTIFSTIAAPRPMPRVVIGPGDVLDVKFFDLPELNESQAVRPDGKIALQLVGDVDVAGLSPAEITENLRTLYQPHLLNPKIAVVVRSFRNNRVYVGGEVRTPGSFELTTAMTPLEAIIQAGGFDMRSAKVKNVVLIRHADGKRYRLQPGPSGRPIGGGHQRLLFGAVRHPLGPSNDDRQGRPVDRSSTSTRSSQQFGLIYTKRLDENTVIGLDTRP